MDVVTDVFLCKSCGISLWLLTGRWNTHETVQLVIDIWVLCEQIFSKLLINGVTTDQVHRGNHPSRLIVE